MNRGARELQEKTPNHGDQARVAREMTAEGFSVGPPDVSRWANGRRRPDPPERAWLEDHYGIGWRLWDEPVESDGPAAAE